MLWMSSCSILSVRITVYVTLQNTDAKTLWFFQRENLEALLKEANHFPVEFAELPSLQWLVSLAKVTSANLLNVPLASKVMN